MEVPRLVREGNVCDEDDDGSVRTMIEWVGVAGGGGDKYRWV